MSMKKIRITLPLMLLLLAAVSCNLWDEPYEKIPNDVLFSVGCPVTFYYIDEEGNSLADIADVRTYPTAFMFPVDSASREEAIMTVQQMRQSDLGFDIFVYNNGYNFLWQDPSGDDCCAFQTYLWGKTPKLDYTTYIYNGASEDSLKVTYQYLTADKNADELPAGSSWGVKITSMLYNTVEVYQDNENGKVFVEKPSHGGETVVHVGSI